jgi:hypothetical protein
MKKILPIVWNDNLLFKYLSKKSIYSIQINNNGDMDKIYEVISDLDSGMEKYCTKIIIISDPIYLNELTEALIKSKSIHTEYKSPTYLCLLDKSETILNDFVQKSRTIELNTQASDANDEDNNTGNTVYESLISKHIDQYIDNLRTYIDIDDMIDDMQIDGYIFHSNREISRLKRIKYKNLWLTTIICDVSMKTLSNKSFEHLFKNIKEQLNNVNPIKNDYLIGKVDFHIILSNDENENDNNDDDIKQYIDKLNEIYDNKTFKSTVNIYRLNHDDFENIQNMTLSLKNKYLHNWSNLTKHILFLYGLYKFQEHYNLNKSQSDYVLMYRCINTDTDNTNITNNKLDQHQQQYIELTREIDRAIKDKKTEYIAVYDSSFAIGTIKVMSFYMLLYQYYGFYKPWLNVRKFQTNGILSSEEYYRYNKNEYMNHTVQMIEHIMHFTDVMLTTIQKVNVKEYRKKTIVFIGRGIPTSFYHNMYNIICIELELESDLNIKYENIVNEHDVVCTVFWRFTWIPEICAISSECKKICVFYQSDIVSHVLTTSINLQNCKIIVIQDTVIHDTVIQDTVIQDTVIQDTVFKIEYVPHHHEYIDTTIGIDYFKKEDITITINLLVVVSNDSIESYNDFLSKITAQYSVETINCNEFTDLELLNTIKKSRMIITDNLNISMMAMSVRTLVLMFRTNNNIPTYDTEEENTYYVELNKSFDKANKQIKIILKKSELFVNSCNKIDNINNILDNAYCKMMNRTWCNFLNRYIIETFDNF